MNTKIEQLIIFGNKHNAIYNNILNSIGDNLYFKEKVDFCISKFQCIYDFGGGVSHNIVISTDIARDSIDNLNEIISKSKIIDTFQTSNINGNNGIYDVMNQNEMWFQLNNKYDLNNFNLKLQTLSNGALNDLNDLNFVIHLKLKFYL